MHSEMEDCTIYNETNKRVRDESCPYPSSPELKRSRVDSVSVSSELNQVDSAAKGPEFYRVNSENESTEMERVSSGHELNRVDSITRFSDRVDSEINSPDSIQITDDILDILEDTNIDSSIQDLDSVIKSFEKEIGNQFPATDSGELDYLLGASDDELGLPPAKSPHEENPKNEPTESVTSPYQGVELNEDFAFVDELPSYDSSEFGLGEDMYEKSDFVTLGGLFDYSETAECLCQPESLTAL